MKRRMTSTIVLVIMLLSLVSLPATAQTQQPTKFRAATGFIILPANHTLRVTIDLGAGNDAVKVRFRWKRYLPTGCNADAACRHTVTSQGATAVMTLNADEAASFDVPGDGNGVQVSVESSSNDLRAMGAIVGGTGGYLYAFSLRQHYHD